MNVHVGRAEGKIATSVVNMRSFDPDIVGSIFTRVDLNWSKEARAQFVFTPLGDLSLIRSKHTANESVSRRLERHMSSEDDGHYFACLPLVGGVEVRRFGQGFEIKPNQLTLLNTNEEYEIAMSDTLDALWLRMPTKLLTAHAISVDDVLGRALDAKSGLGQVAKQMMYGAISNKNDLTERSARIFSHSLLSFLGEVVNTNLGEERLSSTRGRRKILERAQEFIEEHIHDDELNPARIAQGIGISARYLSEIFAAEGTSPMRWVRQRRLELCRMELERQNGGQQLICEIAYSVGFTNISSFNRAFKAHFGHSPRDLLSQKGAGQKRIN
jgi:AraC-like DNA-binding protein